MKVLVTGAAGFIGSTLIKRLLARGDTVVGIDNINDYYSRQLKYDRLKNIGFNLQDVDKLADGQQSTLNIQNAIFIKLDIADREAVAKAFAAHKPDRVVNLAAQAGVRYSLENPLAYADSNLLGFVNILEGCRNNDVQHLVYASSSSVYGANTQMPFSVHHNVDHPLSLYAATKKANELMAHTYSHLYQLPTTGLRFFTVYGPWDRPDMALQKFAKAIMAGKPITLFNYGKHRRDFTYIDDIVEGVIRVLDKPAQSNPEWDSNHPDSGTSKAPWRVYNIGNNHPVELMDYIAALEKALGKVAEKEMLPLQPGDVPDTYADVNDLVEQFDYKPSTSVDDGIAKFAEWYKDYYGV